MMIAVSVLFGLHLLKSVYIELTDKRGKIVMFEIFS